MLTLQNNNTACIIKKPIFYCKINNNNIDNYNKSNRMLMREYKSNMQYEPNYIRCRWSFEQILQRIKVKTNYVCLLLLML